VAQLKRPESSGDAFAWSIPKGEYTHGEDLQVVALREFEETGARLIGPLLALGEVRQTRIEVAPFVHASATSIRAPSTATCSRWSGHPGAGACSPSSKWTGRGVIWAHAAAQARPASAGEAGGSRRAERATMSLGAATGPRPTPALDEMDASARGLAVAGCKA
jgi:hypothetical protein